MLSCTCAYRPVSALALPLITCFAIGCSSSPSDDSDASPLADANVSPDAALPIAPSSWARAIGGIDADSIAKVAIDPVGNVVAVGRFLSSVDFGGKTLDGSGFSNAFVAQYSPIGDLLWVRTPGPGSYVSDVAVDNDGNVYVVGDFDGTIKLGDHSVTSDGLSDGFLAVYSSDGDFLWSDIFGGPGFDSALGVAVSAGTVAITGDYQGVVEFGSDTLTSNGLLRDAFVATYSTAGEHQWAFGFGGEPDGEQGRTVAIAPNGNIGVTGVCDGNVNFGEYAETNDVEPAAFDMFVVVYPAEGGMPVSYKRFGADELAPTGMVFVNDAQVAVAGSFRGTINFGDGSVESNGSDDGFLTLFTEGEATWTRTFGGAAFDGVEGLALSAAGEILVTGFVTNEVDLGAGSTSTDTYALKTFWWSPSPPGY